MGRATDCSDAWFGKEVRNLIRKMPLCIAGKIARDVADGIWLSRCRVRAKDITFWRQRSCGERDSHAQA